YPRQAIPTLRMLTDVAIAEANLGEARGYIQEAFDMLASHPEEHERAQLYQSLGDLEQTNGDLDAAREAYEEALRLMTRLGMRLELAEAHAALDRLLAGAVVDADMSSADA